MTDEQYDRLDAIRESLADDVPYGHVRARDAVQYLLDEHDGDPDVTAAETDGATGSDGGDADDGADDADGEDADDEDGEATDDDPADEGDDEPAADDDADDDGSDDADGSDGDDRLSAMMNLLDTHDDKWEQADSEETRYVVDLPDGGTEEVQTKDDVKAILFKNY